MDIELPGIGPATDNGWNTVYTSPCSGVVRQQHILASIDRADFNGFFDYITAHSKYKPGVYSSVPVWNSVFGSNSASPGSPGYIPHTDEWTYEPETTSLSQRPVRLVPQPRLRSVRAVLRRGQQLQQQRADVAVVRWRRRTGTASGDFDQIDGARHP